MTYVIIIIISFISFFFVKSDNIQISFIDSNKYELSVCISEKSNCFPFKISTLTSETFVFNKGSLLGFLTKSPTFKIENRLGTKVNSKYYSGTYCRDTLFINGTDITMKNFRFVLVEHGLDDEKYYGIIGLSIDKIFHSIDGHFLSFIYSQKYIDSIAFSIGKNKLYLGDNKKIKKKTCIIMPFINNYEKSTCRVQSIMIYNGNSVKNVETDDFSGRVAFTVDFYQIMSPNKFFEFIKEEIFNYYLSVGLCSLIMTSDKAKTIICENKAIDEIDNYNLYFFIDKWSLKFTFKELFKDGAFQIMSSEWNNKWLLGNIVMNNHVVSYNKNSTFISFE